MPFEGDLQKYIPAPVVETETQRLIREARERIPTPRLWRKGDLAQRGRYCLLGALGWRDFCSEDAERVLVTATMHVGAACLEADPRPYKIELDEHIMHAVVFGFNDHHKHADVLRVLDRAYELAGQP